MTGEASLDGFTGFFLILSFFANLFLEK